MKDQGQNPETEDIQVEAALRRFRESVHGWSEQEFSKARATKRTKWDAMWRVMANPVMGWALASLLAIASVGVPVTVHHERQIAAERQAELQRQQKLTEEAAAKTVADAPGAMDDEELLNHVDSDIAQAAPDAMQPLASLMDDSSTK